MGKQLYQDYSIEILYGLYKKFKDEKDVKVDADSLFKMFNYVLENALLNQYAVWLTSKDAVVNVENLAKIKDFKFKDIAITKKAVAQLAEFHKVKNKKINKFIHWEHITPKSLMYEKIKNLFLSKEVYSYSEFSELISEILKYNKIFILSKEEARVLDSGVKKLPEYLQKFNVSNKSEEVVTKLKPFMIFKADAPVRLLFLHLIYGDDFAIHFDGIDYPAVKIPDILDVDMFTLKNKLNLIEKNNVKINSLEFGIKIKQKSKLENYFSSFQC